MVFYDVTTEPNNQNLGECMFRKLLVLVGSLLMLNGAAQAQTVYPHVEAAIKNTTTASEALVIDPRFDHHRQGTTIQYSPSSKSLPTWWEGNRPDWCYSALSWYTAYEAQGNTATNTRVQVRNLHLMFLSNSTRKWTVFDWTPAPHTELWTYPFVFAKGQPEADVRAEPVGGGISIKPAYPMFHHGYGKGYTLPNPADIRAVYVSMQFRLVVDDPAKPDDRANARYVVNAGADYWPGKGETWGVKYAPGIGGSRYLLATPSWRSTSIIVPNRLLGATYDEMRKNPPPY